MIHAIFPFWNFHYWFNGNAKNANKAYIYIYIIILIYKQNQAFPKGNPRVLGVKSFTYMFQKQCTRKL